MVSLWTYAGESGLRLFFENSVGVWLLPIATKPTLRFPYSSFWEGIPEVGGQKKIILISVRRREANRMIMWGKWDWGKCKGHWHHWRETFLRFGRVLKMQMCSSDRQGLPSHTSIPLSLLHILKKSFFAHFLDLADASSRYIREGEGSGGALCQKRRGFFSCRPCCCCLVVFLLKKSLCVSTTLISTQ